MVRIQNYARLSVSGGTKPGRAIPYKADNRRLMREEWAAFCTAECPHPGRQCDRGTCKEFREKFGRRKDA